MSFDSKILFDLATDFSFNTTNVEISGSTIRLKDLGGGTYFNSPAGAPVLMRHRILVRPASAGLSFTDVKSVSGSDTVKYQTVINGAAYYFNTTTNVWTAASSPTGALANTAAELTSARLNQIYTDLGLSSTEAVYLSFKVFLTSADGTTRPTLTSLTLSHRHTYGTPDAISECLLYCYLSDLLGASYVIDSAKPVTLHVKNSRGFMHGVTYIRPFNKTAIFNSDGYAELSVIETVTPGEDIEFFLTYYEGSSLKTVKFRNAQVPNQPTAALSSVTTVRPYDFG